MMKLTGLQITRLMAASHKTIPGLAAQMGITQVRVRFVRKHGLDCPHYVRDWLEAILN